MASSIQDFMVIFHGAVGAVENGVAAEIDLTYTDEESEVVFDVTIRRKPYVPNAGGGGQPE